MGISSILKLGFKYGKKVCNLAPELILGTGSETMGKAMRSAKGSIFIKADAGVKALEKHVAVRKAAQGGFFKRLGKDLISTPKDLFKSTKFAAKAAKAAGKSGIWGGIKGFFKGVAKKMPFIGAVLTVAYEIPNIVTTAKEQGAGAALLETGKSAARLGGGALGAAIGSAICPGIGSIVGWIVGEWLTSKVVGKSYTEQKEEAQEQMAEAQSLEEQQAAELERVGIQDTTAPTETQRAIQREAQERAEMEARQRAEQQTPIVSEQPVQQPIQQPVQQTSDEQQGASTETGVTQGQNNGTAQREVTTPSYTTPSYTTPAYTNPITTYQSPLTNPFLSSTNGFSMSNPYGSMSAISPSFDSYNIFNPYSSYGMYNQTGSIFSNPYQSSQQQDPTKFKYNPNI